MAVQTYVVSLAGGHSDGSGDPVPPVPVLLFPAKDCATTVRLHAYNGVAIGGPGDGNQLWPLPNAEYVLRLPANEELWVKSTEGTSDVIPTYSEVVAMVIESASCGC